MLELEGEFKRWGNSAGLRVRKDELARNKLRFNQKVRVIVIPETTLKAKDLVGTMRIKKSTKEIMREIDRDLDIEF